VTQSQHSASSHATPIPATGSPVKPGKLMRLPEVEHLTGLKKSSIYCAVKAGTFPPPVRLGSRAVAWREEKISAWVSNLKTVAEKE